jgi:hypothetical protein
MTQLDHFLATILSKMMALQGLDTFHFVLKAQI